MLVYVITGSTFARFRRTLHRFPTSRQQSPFFNSTALFTSFATSSSITTTFTYWALNSSFVFKPSSLTLTSSECDTHPDSHIQTSITKPQLMILLGWFNSTPRYFRHYIQIYTDKLGVDTLSHIPPFYHPFFPWTIMPHCRKIARDLIVHWRENGRPNIGFHVFSNNGAYHYAFLCEALREISLENQGTIKKKGITASSPTELKNDLSEDAKELLQSIKSCVMDSGPSPINQKMVALGITGGFLRPAKDSSSASESVVISSASENNTKLKPSLHLINFLNLYFSLQTTQKYQSFAHTVMDNVPIARYLFIYGCHDQIVPDTEIETYMEKLQARNNDNEKESKVVAKKFVEGSDHVQHFLRHPNKYVDALRRFYEKQEVD